MAGYLRNDKRNNESAVKYFLLGSFATAFLLYGIAWIYGLTSTTNLDEIRRAVPGLDSRRLPGRARPQSRHVRSFHPRLHEGVQRTGL
jgi:NADH-quinone oxidoreductase subunit N